MPATTWQVKNYGKGLCGCVCIKNHPGRVRCSHKTQFEMCVPCQALRDAGSGSEAAS